MIANVVVDNPKLIYKNFSGEITPYNTKGMRNFCVILDSNLVELLTKDGWNVRYLKNRREDSLIPYLKISINYKYFNKPEIIVMSPNGKVILEEEQVGMLDKIEIRNSKLILRSHAYTTDKQKGVLAYLKSLEIYDVVVSDSFAKNNDILEVEEDGSDTCSEIIDEDRPTGIVSID